MIAKGGVPNKALRDLKRNIESALKNPKKTMEFMNHIFVLVKIFKDGPAPGWSAMQAEYIAQQLKYKTLVKQGDHIAEYELWVAKKKR